MRGAKHLYQLYNSIVIHKSTKIVLPMQSTATVGLHAIAPKYLD